MICFKEINEYTNVSDDDRLKTLSTDFSCGITEGIPSAIKRVVSSIGHKNISSSFLRAKIVLQNYSQRLSSEDHAWAEKHHGETIDELLLEHGKRKMRDEQDEDAEARLLEKWEDRPAKKSQH